MGDLLRTERVLLRAWTTTPEDVARLEDLYSRVEVTRWLSGPPAGGVTAMLARWAAVHEADPRAGCWAVEPRDGRPVAGTILLKPLPDGEGEFEVGWHLHPDSWGHGYATEAAAAVLARVFAQGLPEVFAVVRPGNEPSLAVCRRLGMTPLGRTTRWYGVECEAFRLPRPS